MGRKKKRGGRWSFSVLAAGLLLLPVLCYAQPEELGRLSITPVSPPSEGIPVFRDYPDKAGIIIESPMTNLRFRSNMDGIVEKQSEPARGRYVLIVEPFTQIIVVDVPGYIQGRFRIGSPQARDVLYYEIEAEESAPDLISVIFNVQPENATLYVDDQQIETNRTIQLPPGSAEVRLEREGYRMIQDAIRVSTENISFTYEMEEIEIALVRIRSNVPGASVLIDGTERGEIDSAGGLDIFLYPGSYALTVRHDGYITENQTLRVSEDDANQISVELQRNIGELSLQVNPSDAGIELNRQDYSGQNLIELAPGRYRLEVEKQGYEPYRETIDIALNERTSRTISLEPHLGSLQFTVSPTNATAKLVDGSDRTVERREGSTVLRGLKAGDYMLVVEAAGYQSREQRVTIRRDETLPINVELQQRVEERPRPAPRPAASGRDNTTTVVEVTNPATGRTWMDRNLGASRAATSSTDSEAYGDLYQWGRPADGHQKRNSPTTSTLSNSDQPGHGSIITSSSGATNWDWRSPRNDNLWQGVNGINNPCPAGYRLPTEAEWEAERQSWSSNNASGAFASPLKLPLAGYRYGSSGSLYYVGSVGGYWFSSVSGSGARGLYFSSGYAGTLSGNRAYGRSVRCAKD